ncbi:DUF1456 family protein [Bacillus sp. AK128]
MNNNDRLIRLRYALDLRNTEMVEIFKLGGIAITKEEVLKLLTKQKESEDFEGDLEQNEGCTNQMLESFLNGFIIYKRGKQDPKPGQPDMPELTNESMNNTLLKKVKIALSLTTEDMLDIFLKAGILVTKGELGALLRREGHKNYKECGDNFARNFLKGLAIKYRS